MDHSPDSVVACIVLRNEIDRLQALLDHHRRLGIEQFFVVDNESDDGSVEFLLEQPDVHLWSSTYSFRESNFGASWFESILRDHAPSNWVAIIDADELLWFESCETRLISDLCAELDSSNFRAMSAALLDMYPKGSLRSFRHSADRSPLTTARWFDRRWCHGMVGRSGPNKAQVGLFGGVRRRLFGGDGWDYCLSKVPLLKFGPDVVLVGGQHWTHLPLAPERAAVLHFKLDAHLVDLAWEELNRGQRVTHVQEYQAYAEQLALHPDLAAFDPTESMEFGGSPQLREFGIIGPIADPEETRHHVGALMTQAEVRISGGETERAMVLLERAVEVEPTAVGPLLRIAALQRSAGKSAEEASAFMEADARRPGDLEILSIEIESAQCQPFWVDELDHYLKRAGREITIVADVELQFSRTESFGLMQPILESPWIGLTNAVVDPKTTLTPFVKRSLPSIWESSALQTSLRHCQALFTFTKYAADWLRTRTDVPVFAISHPVEPAPEGFDLTRFGQAHQSSVVQPGFWFTDLNSILDLQLDANQGANELQKVRCVPIELHRLSRAIARVQRQSTRDRMAPEALRNTIDLGGVEASKLSQLLRNNVVLADLSDANADSILLCCIASATPILVPRLPGTIEHLGADYPLFIDSLAHASDLIRDRVAIAAARDRLRDVQTRHRMSCFLDDVVNALSGARTR